MHAYLVTGAAGYLGSKTTIGLLQRGETVIAALRGARPKNGRIDPGAPSPIERLRAVLLDHGISADTLTAWERQGRLHAIHYDIESLVDEAEARDSFLAAARRTLESIGEKAELIEVVHVAADLSMARGGAGRREKSMKRNAAGTRVTVELALALGASRFTDISTWFVCGADEVLPRVRTREELSQIKWLNFYQESKAWGEREAEDVVAAHNLKSPHHPMVLRVLRPSVVVHDLRRSPIGANRAELHFIHNALLRFYLRRVLRTIGKRRRIYIPDFVYPEQAINLVPVEWIVNAVLGVVGSEGDGIYHLSDPNPPTIHRVLESAFRLYFPLDNLDVSFGEPPPTRSRLLRMIRESAVESVVGDLQQVIPFTTTEFTAGAQREHRQDGLDSEWRENFPGVEEIKIGYLVEALGEERRKADPLFATAREVMRDVWGARRQDRAKIARRGIERLMARPGPSFARQWKSDLLQLFGDRSPERESQRRFLYLVLSNSADVLAVLAEDRKFMEQWTQLIARYDRPSEIETALTEGMLDQRAYVRMTRDLLASRDASPAIAERRRSITTAMGGESALSSFLGKIERRSSARPAA